MLGEGGAPRMPQLTHHSENDVGDFVGSAPGASAAGVTSAPTPPRPSLCRRVKEHCVDDHAAKIAMYAPR